MNRPPSPRDARSSPRPHPGGPCPAVFPGEPSTRCEGIEGHEGAHYARVAVEWETRDDGPEPSPDFPLTPPA